MRHKQCQRLHFLRYDIQELCFLFFNKIIVAEATTHATRNFKPLGQNSGKVFLEILRSFQIFLEIVYHSR